MSVFRGDVRRRGADSRASHIEIRPELAHQHTHDIGVAVACGAMNHGLAGPVGRGRVDGDGRASRQTRGTPLRSIRSLDSEILRRLTDGRRRLSRITFSRIDRQRREPASRASREASRSRRVLRDARDVELLAERAAQRRQPAVPRQRVRLKRLVRESERVPRRDVVFINQILRERAFVVHDVGVDVVRAQQRRDAERFAAARRPVKRRGAVVVTEVRPSAAREQVRDATRRAAIRGDVERPDPHRALHLHVRACVLAEKTHDVEPARVAELDGGVKRRATVEIQRVDVEKIFDVLFRIRRRRMTRRKRRRLAAKPLEGVFRDTHVTGRARLDQGHAV